MHTLRACTCMCVYHQHLMKVMAVILTHARVQVSAFMGLVMGTDVVNEYLWNYACIINFCLKI